MRLIPSFKPALRYSRLNKTLFKIFHTSDSGNVKAFEDNFAAYLGVKHAICVPSGRWGLYYILKNMGLEGGDEIILPSFTYFAVPSAVTALGLKPVFADIESDSLNISDKSIAVNITDKTRAIIPTHLCGFPCDMDKIRDVIDSKDICIIEDCAQSLGSEYKGHKTGSLGYASYFTFGITKNFTTLSGGMVATNNTDLFERIKGDLDKLLPAGKGVTLSLLLKAYIMKIATSKALFPITYTSMLSASLFGMDVIDLIFREKESSLGNAPRERSFNNIQAELGIEELLSLDTKNTACQATGLRLYEALKGRDRIGVPRLIENSKNIFSGCPVFFRDKSKAKRYLLTKGIDSSCGYMQNCASLTLFKEFERNCPNSQKAAKKVLYVPNYPNLNRLDLDYMIHTIMGS